MRSTLRLILFPALHALGPVLTWFSAAMLVPLAVSFIFHDGAERAFVSGVLWTACCGLLLTLVFRPFRCELTARHGFLLVSMTWASIPAFSAIPLLEYLPDQSFAEIYFETVSSLTTTGSTVLSNLDALPLSVNGWRCLLSWLGGMGLIVLAVAILPLLGVGGAQVLKAETSGPLKETKLTPRIAETARALYTTYFAFSVVCAIGYHLAGMPWEDAIMHMMTTVSLAGVSSHDASFAYFNNPMVEVVAIIFMIISGFNFSLHFVAWRRRSVSVYFKDPEAIGWISTLLVLTIGITVALIQTSTYSDWLEALRAVAFSVVSVASSTGYASCDYSLWPYGIPMVLLLSSTFATCAGSAGGGMKMIRLIVLIKQIAREFKHLLYPRAVLPISVGTMNISQPISFAILTYAILWVFSAALASFILLLSGMPATEAISAALACLSNLGPGLGSVGPVSTYAHLTDPQLLILSFLMLIGRLELFTVYILFSRSFWRL